MAGETIERAKVSRIGDAAELAENLRQLRTQLRWHGAGDCTHFETVHARFGEVARIVGGSMLRAYAARTRTLALNAYQRWWQAMQGGVVLNFGKKFPVSQNDGV